ncbi:hypothetical protein [Flaviaesturariibacter terrae]
MQQAPVEFDALKLLYRQEAKKLYQGLRQGLPLGQLEPQQQLVAQLWSRLMARRGAANGQPALWMN